MLRYGQDSITVMSAYAAVFLLKLLNSSNTLAGIPQGAAHEIHALIMKTAEAYFDASLNSPSTAAVFHARFLRNLVDGDVFKTRENGQDRLERFPLDPRLQESPNHIQNTSSQIYPQSMMQGQDHSFKFPASPRMPPVPDPPQNDFPANVQSRDGGTTMNYQFPVSTNSSVAHTHELDAHYWRNIFLDLGFGGADQSIAPQYPTHSHARQTTYVDNNAMLNNMQYPHIPPSGHTSYVT